MRAAQSLLPDHRTCAASATRHTGRVRPFIGLALVAFCTLLAGCGQRGPLYYPVLPPLNAADTQMPANLPMLQTLPAVQSPLVDGTPTTIIAAPQVSLPEAGESTMPVPTKAAPAGTPLMMPLQPAPASAASAPAAASSTTPAAPDSSAQP